MIDLPMDISRAEIDPEALLAYQPMQKTSSFFDFKEVIELLKKAECPMLLLGAGCIGCEAQIQSFVEKTNIPVVTSLMGRGVINETYEYYVGMVGSYGNRCANMSISKADLLIALGTRLDTRQTGAMIEKFLEKGKIIHVDIDKSELDYHRLSNRVKVNLSVHEFLEGIAAYADLFMKDSDWNRWVLRVKDLYSQDKEIERFVENKGPYRLMQALNEMTGENDVITVDIGQNQMWAAQTIRLKKGQRFVTSGGLAAMGFSLPVAIGIAFASPDKTIYCINGDGGFHMAVQSLMLISQYRLNIKVIVLNNEALGMITQFQNLYFDGRMVGTHDGGYLVYDLECLSKAYGMPYVRVSASQEDLIRLDVCKDYPFVLVDYAMEGLTMVCPKLEYNKPIERPIPLLDDSEFDGIMNC